MLRELFTIPLLNVPIFGYGLMLVVACLSAMQLGKWLAQRHGLEPERFVDLALIALLTGVIGARAVHVIENFADYFPAGRSIGQSLWAVVNIRQGGLVYYGGFLLAVPCCIAYGLRHRMPILTSMDIAAPCLMVGLAFGRIGCLLNGCCWGDVCPPSMGITFPRESPPYDFHLDLGLINTLAPRSMPVHPTQIYSFVTAMAVAGICVLAMGSRRRAGQVFALMLMLEGAGRFVIEMLRVNPPVATIGGLDISLSMSIGLGLIGAGGVMMTLLSTGRRTELRAAGT